MSVPQFGKGTIAIGVSASPTDQFECILSEFVVTSSANSITIPGTYCAGPSQAAQGSSYSVNMTYMTDWGETASLSQLLWDNDGDVLYFEFVPEDNTIPQCAGQFYAVAGNFGGEGDNLWTSTGSMPCVDKPTITPQV